MFGEGVVQSAGVCVLRIKGVIGVFILIPYLNQRGPVTGAR